MDEPTTTNVDPWITVTRVTPIIETITEGMAPGLIKAGKELKFCCWV